MKRSLYLANARRQHAPGKVAFALIAVLAAACGGQVQSSQAELPPRC
jgi:hypothetical protein